MLETAISSLTVSRVHLVARMETSKYGPGLTQLRTSIQVIKAFQDLGSQGLASPEIKPAASRKDHNFDQTKLPFLNLNAQ